MDANLSTSSDMDEILAKLDAWASGEDHIEVEVNGHEAITHREKKALWDVLNRPVSMRTSLSMPSLALR